MGVLRCPRKIIGRKNAGSHGGDLAGDHRQRFLVSNHSVLTCIIDSSPREPRFLLVPLRFASKAWPRAGLGEPRSASNANKPASSWPLKQGRKKCSKHGCDRGTSTVASGLGTHKEKKVCVDNSCSSCWVANLLAKHLRSATKFSDG